MGQARFLPDRTESSQDCVKGTTVVIPILQKGKLRHRAINSLDSWSEYVMELRPEPRPSGFRESVSLNSFTYVGVGVEGIPIIP